LRIAERDRDVTAISADAAVQGTGQLLSGLPSVFDLVSTLQQANLNHLRKTLGMTTLKNGRWVDNPYTGQGIGIAVIDSGLDQNITSIDSVSYYNATGGRVVKALTRSDDFGHGTHVAGLLASNGLSSNG